MNEFYHQERPEEKMEESFGDRPPIEQNLGGPFERTYGDPSQAEGPRLEKQLGAIEAQTETAETLEGMSKDIKEIRKDTHEMLIIMKQRFETEDQQKISETREAIARTPFEQLEDLDQAA